MEMRIGTKKKVFIVFVGVMLALSTVACSRPEAIAEKSADQIEYVQDKMDMVEEGGLNEVQKYDELDAGLE